MSESGKNRRDRAAAARDAANAGEKKRERMVRIVGAITVVVVVAGIIGVAVIAKNQSSSSSTAAPTAPADPNAPLPKTVFASTDQHPYGVPYNSLKAGVPVLEVWEDFQCPACEAVEKANGAGIQTLADQGKITLIWRPTTFLDRNLNNDASLRALGAWGCAIDEGKTKEYHNTVFANPPAKEGDGFTDEQLIGFAKTAGLSGTALDSFTKCFNAKTYQPWGTNSTQVFFDSNIQGTPFALLNGVEVPTETLVNQAALEKLVADTAAGKAPSASSSAAPAASSSAAPAASASPTKS